MAHKTYQLYITLKKKSMDFCMSISLRNGLGYEHYHGKINIDFKPCTGNRAVTC